MASYVWPLAFQLPPSSGGHITTAAPRFLRVVALKDERHGPAEVDPKEAKGLDATLSFDWSPGDLNRNNTILTAGLRFNEPLPVRMHNTMSVGYVRNALSQQFLPPGAPPFKSEQGFEFNTLVDVVPMILLQPVIQYYRNPGGGTGRDVVLGFRAKVDF